MACTRFLRSVWIFGFCLGKFNYEVLRNQVGNLDIVFIGNVVINHLISDEELNIRSFSFKNCNDCDETHASGIFYFLRPCGTALLPHTFFAD